MDSETMIIPMSWSQDGKTILYNKFTGEIPGIWAISLMDRKTFAVVNTPFFEIYPQISPDGKYFAYTSNNSGKAEIYVQTFPPGGGKWQISTNGGALPRWRHDGKELFFMDSPAGGKMLSSAIAITGSKFEFAAPRVLFNTTFVNASFGHNGPRNGYAVSADGQRFLLPLQTNGSTNDVVDTPTTVVHNWTRALRKYELQIPLLFKVGWREAPGWLRSNSETHLFSC